MSKSYQLVVFDWEGTLGDTLGPIIHTLVLEAARLNIGVVDESLARKHIMLGLIVAIRKMFPNLELARQEQLLLAVQHSLAASSGDVHLLPGAKALVKKLFEQGFDLAIATNKGHQSLQRVLQATEMDAFFKVTRSAGRIPPKPNPQMLLEIMEQCSTDASNTLMVGDSLSDIEMANSAFVASVGVNFYHQKELEKDLLAEGALRVFDDFQQLADFLKIA